jgi:hypothetical protein
MGCAFRNLSGARRAFHFLALLAVLALPLPLHPEGVSSDSSVLGVVQSKVKAALPEHKLAFEIFSRANRPDQTPKINPALLRIDLKQNLLVWPNIATDLTRSPPLAGHSFS